jgi:serine/threonine protein phosphatase PrpC
VRRLFQARVEPVWGGAPAPLQDFPVGLWPEWEAALPWDVWGATDRGLRRERNEDAFAVLPLAGEGGGMLLAVADGVGGARGGEVASQLAIDTLAGGLSTLPIAGDETPPMALRRAVRRAALAVQQVARLRRDLSGLGTTLTAAIVMWPRLWVAHVGDSRAYLARGGTLQQLTNDHTLGERLRRDGVIPADAPTGRFDSVLWNALGGASRDLPQIEEQELTLQPGDTLLLCSDGLTRHLADSALARRLGGRRPTKELCADLVSAANREGGLDNITAVVARPQPTETAH